MDALRSVWRAKWREDTETRLDEGRDHTPRLPFSPSCLPREANLPSLLVGSGSRLCRIEILIGSDQHVWVFWNHRLRFLEGRFKAVHGKKYKTETETERKEDSCTITPLLARHQDSSCAGITLSHFLFTQNCRYSNCADVQTGTLRLTKVDQDHTAN